MSFGAVVREEMRVDREGGREGGHDNLTSLFVLIRDDASDEVRASAHQGAHQFI